MRNRVAERVMAKVRGTVETAIVELSAERDEIDLELQLLVAFHRQQTEDGRPKDGRRKSGKKSTRDIALAFLSSHREVTPAMVAKQAGIAPQSASWALKQLVVGKQAKQIRRGVYGRA